jgi:hypothetical protein
MKNISIKLFSLASAVALLTAGTGCAKISEFGDTNVNPNGSANPITAALLTNVESGLGGIAFGTGTGGTRAAIYAQLISETQYTDVSLYQLPQLENGPFYSGAMEDLQTIINQNTNPATAGVSAVSGSNANQIAISKILKSWIIWTLTDKWGDLPYSQALQGAGNKAPSYDTQEAIYKAIFKDCADAIAGFDGGLAMKGDIIYGGDQAKWKKLANSITIMAALRLTKRYPNNTDYPALAMKAAFTSPWGYISSNADNFTIPFPGGSYKNTWYTTYDGRTDYAESKTLGDVLSALGDTRQAAFGSSSATFPYGLTRTNAIAFDNSTGGNYARVMAPAYRAENSPGVLLSSSQVLLAIAEGIEWSWISGSAQNFYEAGVTASFGQWGITIPSGYLTGAAAYNTGVGAPGNVGANAYGSIPATQNAATINNKARIALQYWLAAYPNGNEAWANWRRTGVPNLKGTLAATNSGGLIPRRYVYGVNEYSLNPTQLNVAIGRLTGGDTQDSRIWWDQ